MKYERPVSIILNARDGSGYCNDGSGAIAGIPSYYCSTGTDVSYSSCNEGGGDIGYYQQCNGGSGVVGRDACYAGDTAIN